MLIYYITIFVLLLSGILLAKPAKDKKFTILYLIFACLVLTGLASFRYAIGFDYFSYESIYEKMAGLSFIEILKFYWHEPLYYLICKIIASTGMPYLGFLLFYNITIHAVAMRTIFQFSKIPWISVYLYITLQFFAHNMNLMRQSVSITFFLLAFPCLKSRKFLPYCLLIIIGSLFHNSLLIAFPLYFLLLQKHTVKFTALIIGAAALLYILFDPLFYMFAPYMSTKMLNYQTGFTWHANSFAFIVLPSIYLLLMFLFRKKLLVDHKNNVIYINSALYTFLFQFFITRHFILERFSVYPFILSILAIPEVISLYSENKRIIHIFSPRCLLFILFLSYGAAYFLFAASKGFHHVYPYFSLLQKASTPGN